MYLWQWRSLLILCYCERGQLCHKLIDKRSLLSTENRILILLEVISACRFLSFTQIFTFESGRSLDKIRQHQRLKSYETSLGSDGLLWRVFSSSIARFMSFCRSSSGILQSEYAKNQINWPLKLVLSVLTCSNVWTLLSNEVGWQKIKQQRIERL